MIKIEGERICFHLDRMVRESVEETPSYVRLPPEHWRQIRTNNPVERVMREIQPPTRVVGAFPDG